MTEDDYVDLLAFFHKEGKYWFIGGGLTTYPDWPEKRPLYDACCELERRGHLTSWSSHPGVVHFKAVEMPPRPKTIIFPQLGFALTDESLD